MFKLNVTETNTQTRKFIKKKIPHTFLKKGVIAYDLPAQLLANQLENLNSIKSVGRE